MTPSQHEDNTAGRQATESPVTSRIMRAEMSVALSTIVSTWSKAGSIDNLSSDRPRDQAEGRGSEALESKRQRDRRGDDRVASACDRVINGSRSHAEVTPDAQPRPAARSEHEWHRRHRPEIHVVYRVYDESGVLLYVGVTNDWGTRKYFHVRKEWWSHVARVVIEPFMSRAYAEHGEAYAIATEAPLHNKNPPPAMYSVRVLGRIDNPLADEVWDCQPT